MTAPTCLPVSRLPADAAPPDIALFLPTLYSGGAERVQINLAEYFLAQGLKVDFVVCKYYGSLRDKVPSGARLISLDASRVMFSLPAYLRYLRAARPAVVLSSVENANIISCVGRMVSSHRHRLIVRLDNSLTELGSLPLQMRRRLLTLAIAATFHAADQFVAVSDGLKAQLACLPGLGNKPIHRIYNPIIHDGFDALASERAVLPPAIGPGQPFVLAVGRLHAQKDYKTLLPAFARAHRQRPAHLVILGEGDDRAELEAFAAALGIASYVHFLGYAANPLAYMRQAAVFVLSSIAEGFGNVIVEALACGAPVISTDCPHGPSEILVQGRFGALVPIGDVDALGDAIAASLSRPRPAMSAELKDHLQLFSIETIGRQYMSKLDLVAGGAEPNDAAAAQVIAA